MKILIIEGPDNTGKTTLINRLMEQYNDVYYIHCSKPKETDPILCAIAQKNSFQKITDKINDLWECNICPELVILNRAWYGEYVYGCLYRGNGEEYVEQMIKELEEYLPHNMPVRIVLMTAENPEFLVKNEDGQSLSEGKKESIQIEINRFNYIINKSELPHKTICIHDKKGEFKSKDEIYNTVIKFLNN